KELVNEGRPRLDLTACNRCHDAANAAPVSPYVPAIAGQDEAYLKRSLQEYRDESRQSGFMEPVADDLYDEHIERLAAYYASLSPTLRKPSRTFSLEELELGRLLAEHGDRERKVPSCNSCHGGKRREDYPRLAGQSAQYIKQQLRVWRDGGRNNTPHGAMMSVVAKRMTGQQAAAAASFYASRSPEAERFRRNGREGASNHEN
ncbi:MAG: c-type cytochrome, partial [Methylosarcina sp.]